MCASDDGWHSGGGEGVGDNRDTLIDICQQHRRRGCHSWASARTWLKSGVGSGWGNPRGKLERSLQSEELAVREQKITHFLHLRRQAGKVQGDTVFRSSVQEPSCCRTQTIRCCCCGMISLCLCPLLLVKQLSKCLVLCMNLVYRLRHVSVSVSLKGNTNMQKY